MQAIRTKIGKGGRVIIPTAFRKNLHLEAGSDIILHMVDNTIYLTTSDQALLKLQMKVKKYSQDISNNISLVDTLIASRRKEAANE